MPKLRGFQQGLYGYVDVLSINESSMQPQLLPGTLTFLVYEDEEVSKECLPWNVLSISVLSVARGIASEDLDRPNEWRHHESETNVQTEDVQATHWMHSMTTTPEVLCGKLLNLEVTVGVAVSASKCCQILSAQNDHSHVQTPITSKAIVPPLPPPPTTAVCDLPHPSGPSFNEWQWNVSRHNLTPIEPVFDDDAKHEPWPET